MKDWLYHYDRAEELLRQSDSPNMGYKREVYIAQAQVHATLATLRHEQLVQETMSTIYRLPPVYADMPLFGEPNPDHTDD